MKRFFIFFSMIFLFTGVAMAQRTIQGSVKSSGQEPLIGANVVVKGTTTGTTTDLDGSFKLSLQNSAGVLVISYTGYETQEITLTSSNQYNILLSESALGLEEVVDDAVAEDEAVVVADPEHLALVVRELLHVVVAVEQVE
ncbi:MAG: carboxypeptidase-like regulatory domain-containing protein, partial [Bacteroidota bacterium]